MFEKPLAGRCLELSWGTSLRAEGIQGLTQVDRSFLTSDQSHFPRRER